MCLRQNIIKLQPGAGAAALSELCCGSATVAVDLLLYTEIKELRGHLYSTDSVDFFFRGFFYK